jgi:hypothetical protein
MYYKASHLPTRCTIYYTWKGLTLHKKSHKDRSYTLRSSTILTLQKNAPQLSPILHSTQHTRHSQGKPNHIFTCLFVYLFGFYFTLYGFSHIQFKKHLFIADMLPQHTNYKDKIYYNVTLARLHTSSLRMVEDRNM